MRFIKHLLIVLAILIGGIALTGAVAGVFGAALPEFSDPLVPLTQVAGLILTVVFAVRHIVRAVRQARAG
jgi:negative regulator of sigma E activity